MVEARQTWRLDGHGITLVLVAAGQDNIDLAYLGPRLPDDENLDLLVRSGQFGKHENQPDMLPVGGLLPQNRGGYAGRPAYRIWSGTREVDCDFRLANADVTGEQFQANWTEQNTGLAVALCWKLVGERVIQVTSELYLGGDCDVTLQAAATLSMPLPAQFTHLTAFPGRWAREMQSARTRIGRQAIEMQSTGGKPGFDGGNWLVLEGHGTHQRLGVHASSNGDHRVHVAQDQDGRASLMIEALRQAGGIELKAGDSISLNSVTLALGDDKDHLTQLFHNHVRENILPDRSSWSVRKVHLNSWEALGFDLDEAKLMKLADAAADLGVERFVLDDGWFKGRRSDNAGLGDWQVDGDIFPDGLTPLIDHIHGLGMDFGLWVEPEMISPDSDLYRAHPGWCLHNDSAHRPTERNQLVLDLSREEVFQHIEAALCALVEDNDIAYLKWDHNRRLFPDNGVQQFAIDRLLRSLRQKYPDLEIESCSSGGGRVSFSILEHCHRIWPSDNNDPIERSRIMDSWTRFLPLEVLGNHVGPSPNPITARRTDMDFRAKVALFGHMGVEANPADMDAEERDVLRLHIALYKESRAVLHEGDFWRLDHPEDSISGQMMVHGDKAIALVAQTAFAENFNVAPVRFKGLENDAFYQVRLPEPWPAKASRYLADAEGWRSGHRLSGRALMERGLAVPLTHPETAWIITLEKDDS